MVTQRILCLMVGLGLMIVSSGAPASETETKKSELWRAVLDAVTKLKPRNNEIDTQAVKAAIPKSLLPAQRLSQATEKKLRREVLKAIEAWSPPDNKTDLKTQVAHTADPLFIVEKDGQIRQYSYAQLVEDTIAMSDEPKGSYRAAERIEVLDPKIEFLDGTTAIATYTERTIFRTYLDLDEWWTVWTKQEGRWKLAILSFKPIIFAGQRVDGSK